MTTGKKIYFGVVTLFVVVAAFVHLFFGINFLFASFGSENSLAWGLTVVFIGILWIIAGGISSLISFILSLILIKVSKKWALIFVGITVLVTVIGLICWVISLNVSPQTQPTSWIMCV